ncbi:hypothetical protein Golob_014657, partial [Gossypium lobatum]|nr:hypothetical protein [Gossypium lobatum]
MEENDRVREWGLHCGRFGKLMEGRSRSGHELERVGSYVVHWNKCCYE